MVRHDLRSEREEHRIGTGVSVDVALGAVSHVKLNIYPDGGVSRLRIFGKLA
mgnify:CR=1 FL=1